MEPQNLCGFRAIHTELPTKLSTAAVDGCAVFRRWIRCDTAIEQKITDAGSRSCRSRAIIARPERAAAQSADSQITAKRTGLFSIIREAGWPIWPLILCSVVALTIIIERLSSLRAARIAPPRLLDEVISVTRAHLPAADVVNKLADNSILGSVLANGLRVVVADPRVTEEVLRSAFENGGRAAVHKMERFLNTLGTIASSAPLLGLLGTVIGMIEIFGSQAPTGGTNPALLAHGISVALYNTAFGLIVAIPSLMFYRYFRGQIDAFTLEMEQASERMVPHLMRFAVPAKKPAA
ncbi:MAG: hypothetical protein RLZZ618_2512 [Pseudomonadota bacterium]